MTKLKFINMFFFQWLFVRLTKCSETIVIEQNIISYHIMLDGSYSSRSTGKTKKLEWYSIQGFIIPTTGWGKPYKYIGETGFFRITKKKEINE